MADSPFIEDPILRAKVFREYPYDLQYYDWCLTTLDVDPKIDLHQMSQWHEFLRRLSENMCIDRVLWSRDLEQSHCVLVFVCASIDIGQDVDFVWDPLGPALVNPPMVKHIVLKMQDHYPVPSHVQEIFMNEGDSNIVISPFLSTIDFLLMRATPQLGHDPAVELVGCARGFAQSEEEGRASITAMFVWIDLDKRDSFIDPAQESFGEAAEYENRIAKPIRRWKAQGVSVTSHLLQLQWWNTSLLVKPKKQRCVIL